ncbi:MAG: hypothetical protein Q9165_006156 [Trypethelium subeluteriae]
MDGIFVEKSSNFSTLPGGGGKMAGPLILGSTVPKSPPPPPPIGGQNQQCAAGNIGHPCESCVAVDTPDVMEVVILLQSTVIIGGAVVPEDEMVEVERVEVLVVPPVVEVDIANDIEGDPFEVVDELLEEAMVEVERIEVSVLPPVVNVDTNSEVEGVALDVPGLLPVDESVDVCVLSFAVKTVVDGADALSEVENVETWVLTFVVIAVVIGDVWEIVLCLLDVLFDGTALEVVMLEGFVELDACRELVAEEFWLEEDPVEVERLLVNKELVEFE